MKKSLLAIAILAISSTAMAQADSKYYGEISYGGLKYSEPGFWARPGVGTAKFGINLDKNFSVEGMIGTTINDATGTIYGYSASAKYDNIYGAYLKAKTSIADQFEVFGRVGFTSAKASVTVAGRTYSDSSSDFSYGVGLQYNFDKNWYGQVDYMSYYNKNSATVKGPSVGVGYKF